MKRKWICYYTYTFGADTFYAKNEKEAKEKAIELIKEDIRSGDANPEELEEPLENLIEELYPYTLRDYLYKFICFLKREDCI